MKLFTALYTRDAHLEAGDFPYIEGYTTVDCFCASFRMGVADTRQFIFFANVLPGIAFSLDLIVRDTDQAVQMLY